MVKVAKNTFVFVSRGTNKGRHTIPTARCLVSECGSRARSFWDRIAFERRRRLPIRGWTGTVFDLAVIQIYALIFSVLSDVIAFLFFGSTHFRAIRRTPVWSSETCWRMTQTDLRFPCGDPIGSFLRNDRLRTYWVCGNPFRWPFLVREYTTFPRRLFFRRYKCTDPYSRCWHRCHREGISICRLTCEATQDDRVLSSVVSWLWRVRNTWKCRRPNFLSERLDCRWGTDNTCWFTDREKWNRSIRWSRLGRLCRALSRRWFSHRETVSWIQAILDV